MAVRDEDEVIQVVMHKVAWQTYEKFLALRGLTLDRMPDEMQREDDLPTYTIGLSDELAARMQYLSQFDNTGGSAGAGGS